MRDTRTGAARKETPKGAAVDRTGKRGMPTPAGKAKATEVTKAKTAEARRAKAKGEAPKLAGRYRNLAG